MSIFVSVMMAVYNEEKFITDAVDAVLSQTFKNFEFIIIDNGSTDKTTEIIKTYTDPRIKLLSYTKNRNDVGAMRRLAVNQSQGNYFFCTDADCIPSENWIAEGLSIFKKYNCDGVEGKTYYVSEKYIPTLSDRVVSNISGGLYLGANVAYKTSILRKIKIDSGMLEDRQMAAEIGFENIRFSEKMIVIHQKKKRTLKTMLNDTNRIEPKIKLIKFYNDVNPKIFYPFHLLALFFPPSLLLLFLQKRIKTFHDLKVLAGFWFFVLYERVIIWKNALRYRIPII